MAPRQRAGSPGTASQPVLRVARSQLEGEIQKRFALGQELLDRPVPPQAADVNALDGDFSTWDEFNEQLLRSRFTTSKVADEYKRVTAGFGGQLPPDRELYWIHEAIRGQMRKLASIRQQLELFESEAEEAQGATRLKGSSAGAKIFVVHGHDGAVKLQVAEFLEKLTGERPVILHEKADTGRTVIEKFEDYASEAGFAVVLLTADDEGKAKGAATLNYRARQNVVLELGFFFGKLGRRRVVALYEDGVELPSDVAGVLYKPLSGNWHTELARELRAAGIAIDPSKLF